MESSNGEPLSIVSGLTRPPSGCGRRLRILRMSRACDAVQRAQLLRGIRQFCPTTQMLDTTIGAGRAALALKATFCHLVSPHYKLIVFYAKQHVDKN